MKLQFKKLPSIMFTHTHYTRKKLWLRLLSPNTMKEKTILLFSLSVHPRPPHTHTKAKSTQWFQRKEVKKFAIARNFKKKSCHKNYQNNRRKIKPQHVVPSLTGFRTNKTKRIFLKCCCLRGGLTKKKRVSKLFILNVMF